MRLGTTHKVDARVSANGRAFTGSKGIGRLSVQFLADEMILETTSADRPGKCLYVVVDWSTIVRGRNLNEVELLWQERSDVPEYPNNHATGTRITLTKLKSKWDADALEGLGREVWTFRSPFKAPPATTASRRAEEFSIEVAAPSIESGTEAFDKVRRALFSNWRARIRGVLESGRSGGTATVVVEFKSGYPEHAEKPASFRQTVPIPIRPTDGGRIPLIDQAGFEILIYKPEGVQPGRIPVGELRDYLARFGNVSVYDAGFRLPYYGSGRDVTGQDWLSIAQDQGRRLNVSELLPPRLRTQNKYTQDLPAPGRIFGAVDINTNHEREVAHSEKAKVGDWLQIQPGRDRLHDNDAFAQLRDLVRLSLDFYANRHRLRAVQATDKRRAKEPASGKHDRVVEALDRHRADIPAPIFRAIKREAVDARKASVLEEEALDQRAVLLAPLASAGMVALALSHELLRESRVLKQMAKSLRRIATKHRLPDVRDLAKSFDAARGRLSALQELFAPLLSEVDTEATDRLKVLAVVEQVADAMRVLMPNVEYDFSGIQRGLYFPVGSFAEWSALLQNVMSNSWNAMLDSDRATIAFDAGRREWLQISDTGQGLNIPIAESAKLFEPFERRLEISDDNRSIAIGGQGLGLAIVRMIASRRGAKVAFVQPRPEFATTLEMSWKG